MKSAYIYQTQPPMNELSFETFPTVSPSQSNPHAYSRTQSHLHLHHRHASISHRTL